MSRKERLLIQEIVLKKEKEKRKTTFFIKRDGEWGAEVVYSKPEEIEERKKFLDQEVKAKRIEDYSVDSKNEPGADFKDQAPD